MVSSIAAHPDISATSNPASEARWWIKYNKSTRPPSVVLFHTRFCCMVIFLHHLEQRLLRIGMMRRLVRKCQAHFFPPKSDARPEQRARLLMYTYGLVGNPPGVSRQDLGRCGGKEKLFTAIQDRTKGLSAQSGCQRVRYLPVWWTAGFWGTPPTHLSAVPTLTGGEPRTMVCTWRACCDVHPQLIRRGMQRHVGDI